MCTSHLEFGIIITSHWWQSGVQNESQGIEVIGARVASRVQIVSHICARQESSKVQEVMVEVLVMIYMIFYESNGGEVIVSGESELECYKAFVSQIDAVGIECDEEGNEKQ